MKVRQRTNGPILLFALAAGTASLSACGENSAGPTSGPLVAAGFAMASAVNNGKFEVAMVVEDPALAAFADKAKTAFAKSGGTLAVNFVKLRLDLQNSTGVAGLQDVFESISPTDIFLKQFPGTNEVRAATIGRPAGSSPVTASIVVDGKALETVEPSVLSAMLGVTVRGPAKLNSAGNQKVGLIVTFQLQAIPSP